MTQSQPLAIIANCQSWEGRIVNGKYALRQYVGMSDALAVYQTEIAGACAVIKLLPVEAAQADAQVASWKLASRLSHPNLVRVLDTGLWHADDERDMQFAVMEYCDESLAAVLRQRAITAQEARVMLAPTLEALSYLHRNGVQHGQVSPANALAIGEQLKLSADSVRRCTDPDGATTATVYDAPEKASGTPSLSSDAWALGVTLCEALTRRVPLRGKNGALEVPEKLPAPFDEIVKGCLTAERERRLSIAGIASLLERPSPELVKAAKPETKVEDRPAADIRLVRPAASSATVAGNSIGSNDAPTKSVAAGRKPLVIAVVALILLFGILFAVRFGHRSELQNSPAIASHNVATASQPITVAAGNPPTPATAPGSVVYQAMPEISGKARNTIHGTVTVKVTVAVNADGKVARASLVGRGSSAYFERQSLEAARQWTFAPPLRDGNAQPSEWALRFEFRKSGARASAHRV